MQDNNLFRYSLEQKILPNSFYAGKEDFLYSILEKNGKFFSDIITLFAPPESTIYNEKDFEVTAKHLSYREDDEVKKKLYLVIVDMPQPEEVLWCRRLYFCYEENSKSAKYYTSELALSGDYLICSVNKNGIRNNYGKAPQDLELEFRKVGNMFLKKLIGKD